MVIVAATLPAPVIVARAGGGPAKVLPGNKACPYPPEAHRQQVAGPVHFGARVRPDGTVESVTIDKVPLPTLGLRGGRAGLRLRVALDLAPPGEADARLYRGKVRFQIAPQETP